MPRATSEPKQPLDPTGLTAETHGFIFPNTASASGKVWQQIGESPGVYEADSPHTAVGPLTGTQTGWMLWQQWAFGAPGGTYYWHVCWDPAPDGGTVYCGPEQKFTMPNPNNVMLPDTSIPTGPTS